LLARESLAAVCLVARSGRGLVRFAFIAVLTTGAPISPA
jgi:hypothetical protein